MARRLFVPCLFLTSLAALACDPDLTPVKHGGDASPEASVTPEPTPNPSDSGTTDNDGSITPNDGGVEDDGSTGGSHKIDGVNDFKADEKFVTTSISNGYEGFFAWDDKRIYVGMSGSDVGSGASNKWVHVYLGMDGTAGSTTGIDYGGQQQPTLPFAASYHLRWKASNDFTTVEKWNGSAWEAAGVINVPIVAAKQGTFMEMSVTRASIGATGKLKVHMNMLIEGGGNDWTYSGVPSTSFTDGKDPNFSKYYEFDLADTSKAPGSYQPK